jgi:hypothetical protein
LLSPIGMAGSAAGLLGDVVTCAALVATAGAIEAAGVVVTAGVVEALVAVAVDDEVTAAGAACAGGEADPAEQPAAPVSSPRAIAAPIDFFMLASAAIPVLDAGSRTATPEVCPSKPDVCGPNATTVTVGNRHSRTPEMRGPRYARVPE